MIATGKQMSTLNDPDGENPALAAEVDMPLCVTAGTATTQPAPIGVLNAAGWM